MKMPFHDIFVDSSFSKYQCDTSSPQALPSVVLYTGSALRFPDAGNRGQVSKLPLVVKNFLPGLADKPSLRSSCIPAPSFDSRRSAPYGNSPRDMLSGWPIWAIAGNRTRIASATNLSVNRYTTTAIRLSVKKSSLFIQSLPLNVERGSFVSQSLPKRGKRTAWTIEGEFFQRLFERKPLTSTNLVCL